MPSGAGESEVDVCSLQICQEGEEGARELEGCEEGQQLSSAVGAVQVREVNLDRPSDWQQLGLAEQEAHALREEIPIVVVGRQEVCRLKFNGPAVRAALLREVERLRLGRRPQ